MAHHKLEPVDAQRVVLDEGRRLGTAVDVCCYDAAQGAGAGRAQNGLCGRPRAARARPFGRVLGMQAPLAKAVDCALHRHLSQARGDARALPARGGHAAGVKRKGIHKVEGALLYVTDHASECTGSAPGGKSAARALDRLGRG